MAEEDLVRPDSAGGRTRAELLRRALEDMILAGTLAPGDRLDEVTLAANFRVSRTPVREAIKALIALELVEMRDRQGAFVVRLSVPTLLDMFEMMSALEGMCAKLAARRASDAQRRQMRKLHLDLVQACDDNNPVRFYHLNTLLHDLFYEASHSEFIGGEALRLRRRLNPYRRKVTYRPGTMRSGLGQHLRIIEAIEGGDAAEAERAAADHLRLMGDDLFDFIAVTHQIGEASQNDLP